MSFVAGNSVSRERLTWVKTGTLDNDAAIGNALTASAKWYHKDYEPTDPEDATWELVGHLVITPAPSGANLKRLGGGIAPMCAAFDIHVCY